MPPTPKRDSTVHLFLMTEPTLALGPPSSPFFPLLAATSKTPQPGPRRISAAANGEHPPLLSMGEEVRWAEVGPSGAGRAGFSADREHDGRDGHSDDRDDGRRRDAERNRDRTGGL